MGAESPMKNAQRFRTQLLLEPSFLHCKRLSFPAIIFWSIPVLLDSGRTAVVFQRLYGSEEFGIKLNKLSLL